MSSSSNIRIVPQPILHVGVQLAPDAAQLQSRTGVHPEQSTSRPGGLPTTPERAAVGSKLTGMRVRELPDPSARRMRLTGGSLPYSQRVEPPRDIDSTKVLVRPSGKAVVVFARDAKGKRHQVFVGSVAEATETVVAYRLVQVVEPLLAWLASFLPPRAKRPLAKTVADSGVRTRPSDNAGFGPIKRAR